MGLTRSTFVDSPLQEVFAWHERPGAVVRLTPPWIPIKVVSEASSLRDGTATFALPGGATWVARHDPAAYDPPYRFADELISLPLAPLLRWRHTHELEAAGAGSTRVTDTIQTRAPGFALAQTLAYRHRQLAGDLASHERVAGYQSVPMTIAMTGATGLVGAQLGAFLTSGGHQVIRLVRHQPRSTDERRWQPLHPEPSMLDGVDAVVHLAGASIAGRFTRSHMRKVRDSRIEPTRLLSELVAKGHNQTRTLVVASAVGYYGPDRGDEILTEGSGRGGGFLADLVTDWEAASTPAERAGVRVVRVRTGIVQSPAGGTLGLLRPLFASGLGGRIGDGRAWQSWIGIDDLVDVYSSALVDDRVSGPVNAVAPNPVRNAEYAATLARVLRRPALLPVPALGPRLLMGERGVEEVVLASQRVAPARLADLGHHFREPGLEGALRHLLGHASA